MSNSERTRSAAEVLERIAAAVMAADPSDVAAVKDLVALFEQLAADAATSDPAIRVEAVGQVGRLCAALESGPAALAGALDEACEATARMQDAIAHARSRPASAGGAADVTAEAGASHVDRDGTATSRVERDGTATSRVERDGTATSRVERDDETVGLFGEFLSESAEGLTQVDQTLMNVERDGAAPETVNSLFRVFHTIKGTAGFLELEQVVALAHVTESMLNTCREGTLALRGAVVDLVFDATAALREMLDGIREAVEKSAPLPRARADLDTLVHRIEATNGGDAPEERRVASAMPGERLGDVLSQPPLSVPPEVIARSAEAQTATGRRLGEQLVADGAAKPAEVAQALRALSRAAGEPDGPVKIRETLKVDVERVDSLVEMIGELVVVESMVENAPEISGIGSVRVRNCLAQLAKVTRDLQDVGMRMRMVPVAGAFQKMARLVRDLSRKSGKQVRLVTSGEATEMDRSMVEQIADPLVHMIRNSMDHGLETPEERAAAGKPPEAVVRLSAFHEGGSVVIELGDDGRGLDEERIAAKAIEKGLIASTEGMSDAEVHALIFSPGFSTASQVTEISGRGVGMDVVRRNIEAMRGRIAISTAPGRGTTFKLVLPLTLAIIDGMLVACGDERYIVPTLSIVESIKPDPSMLVTLARTNEMINLRGEILPLLRMDRLFGVRDAKADATDALVVVVEGAGRRVGLLVDEVVAQQQVVIKTLSSGLRETEFVSGAAILADGRVGLILNVDEVAGLVDRKGQAARKFERFSASPGAIPAPALSRTEVQG
ncbi:MAG TPA: chemotaxis protein CheA [Anaeromyxobacteraceae bacterium]|nr:chemotaxis protein CheA [Anaeromyxobacteraceae bacterium]